MSKKLTAKSLDALLKRTQKSSSISKAPKQSLPSSSPSATTASTPAHKRPFTRQNTHKKRRAAKPISQLPPDETGVKQEDSATKLERNLAFLRSVKASEKERGLKNELLKKT
ncbi:hypothetical protein HDV00_002391 [Rhizophlyctis rosea]|nr:hypothetical protein HDV00_002391 [Rhizophlyctis rosea]